MGAGDLGVDEALLRRFVPLNGLDAAHLAELLPFAGLSDLHPGDSIPTNFKKADQAYYLVDGELELYSGAKLVGTVSGGSSAARFPLSQLEIDFGAARARSSVRLLRVDRSRLSALMILDEPAAGATARRRAAGTDKRGRDLVSRLLRSQLFSQIPPANVHRLLELTEPVRVHTGDVVVRQGEQGNYCYVVEEGRCAVARREPSELGSRKIGELGPGDSFGEEVLGKNRVRRFTVTMLSDGWLRRLSKAQFDQLSGRPSVTLVSWNRARELASRGARWLDVRLREEHQHDGIARSVSVPLSELRERMAELDRQSSYIVYCNTGQRSLAAAFLMREQGYSVCVLEGGLMARDSQPGNEPSTADELKAQLMLANAEIQTAERSKARAEQSAYGHEPTPRERSDAHRAAEALSAAQRRKRELEIMIRAVEARAANERQQAESAVEQIRRQTDVRLEQERSRLQAEVSQSAGAMEDLRRARADAEAHFQRERERLEAQIAQAREAMMAEAQRIRTEMEAAKRAAGEKAERIRREQVEAERRLRAETEARLQAERRKLQGELEATMQSLSRATDDLASAQGAKRDAERHAERLAAELRAAEARRSAQRDDAEASRRLAASQGGGRAGSRPPANVVPSNVVQFQPSRPERPFDPSDTVVALRTELSAFEEKVAKANERVDAAERARAHSRQAQMLVEEKLAQQHALEEELQRRLALEAQSLLEEERIRGHDDSVSEAERLHREARKREEKRRAEEAAANMMSDIHSQLSDAAGDEPLSVLERNLRLRDEEARGASLPEPDPDVQKAAEERRKAKEALDRAREHVQRIKKRYDSE
ncbi:MAG: cyclic nucleotide-binding domain-containing protein [Gammaproteobacteria bacterium]|nr:cyclic nucleotide-binding domain-containing protein [Gammaproteobacteria bacterium]